MTVIVGIFCIMVAITSRIGPASSTYHPIADQYLTVDILINIKNFSSIVRNSYRLVEVLETGKQFPKKHKVLLA